MSAAWWKSMVRWPMSLHQNFHKRQCAWKEMWQPIMDSLHKACIFHAIYTVVELNAWCLTKLLLSVTEKKQFYNNIFMPWMNKQFANQRLLYLFAKYTKLGYTSYYTIHTNTLTCPNYGQFFWWYLKKRRIPNQNFFGDLVSFIY